MDLQAIFSDNQLAVMGCFAALAVCGGIALLSFQFGVAGKHSENAQGPEQQIHSLPSARSRTESSETDQRRAA